MSHFDYIFFKFHGEQNNFQEESEKYIFIKTVFNWTCYSKNGELLKMMIKSHSFWVTLYIVFEF